jgi:hypothetical protein
MRSKICRLSSPVPLTEDLVRNLLIAACAMLSEGLSERRFIDFDHEVDGMIRSYPSEFPSRTEFSAELQARRGLFRVRFLVHSDLADLRSLSEEYLFNFQRQMAKKFEDNFGVLPESTPKRYH